MERAIFNPIPEVAYPTEDDARRYLASGAWMDTTLGELLRHTARRVPEKPAYVDEERQLSFRELDERTERIAAGLLDRGLAPGERALFQLGTTIETVEALLACFKAGIVPVCSVPQYREVEMGQLAILSGAVAHFVQVDVSAFDMVGFAKTLARKHAALRHLILVRGGRAADGQLFSQLGAGLSLKEARERVAQVRLGNADVVSFQLSGGTTGVPKIIPRFHGEYAGHARDCAKRFGYATQDGSSIWNLPLAHNAGQVYILVPNLLFGRTVYLQPRVDIALFCEWIERHRITHAASIGPVAPQLMAFPDAKNYDLSSLDIFVTMNRADALEALLEVPATNLYGITEGLLMGCHPSDPVEARHRTNGSSGCPDDEIRVLAFGSEEQVPPGEVGELCFRGPSSLRSYYGAPEATRDALTSDGFVRTGDMVSARSIGERTYYAFEGRVRDNINRGGEKIGCEEVEGYISEHPAVADAKLVPMPDPLYGEKGCVFIVLRPGHNSPTTSELAQFLIGRGLAKFKCPERVEIVTEFPITRVGKVDKPAMKRWISERIASEQEGNA